MPFGVWRIPYRQEKVRKCDKKAVKPRKPTEMMESCHFLNTNVTKSSVAQMATEIDI